MKGLNHNLGMLVRWCAFVVWALVAASALAWGLKIFVRPQPAPPQALVAEAGAPARGDLTRLLGADPPPVVAVAAPEPVADTRFQLVGVVSPRSPQAAREGLALIAVDGKPPRAYRVGTAVDGPNVLQRVDARGATLGPSGGAALVALKLPPPAAAATGVLPPATAPGAARPPPLPGGAVMPPTVPGGPMMPAPRFGTPTRVAPAAAQQEPNEDQPAQPIQPAQDGRVNMR